MRTEYLTELDLELAGKMLAANRLVAFPTETVYGLGGNAWNEEAVQAIFQAKGRPADNPLIVHIADYALLSEIAQESSLVALALMHAFWPGPLTLVMRRAVRVPKIVSAGLDTVAVRMPKHPWATAILRAAGVPVAAPSANRSGSPSATTWQAVQADLEGRIDAIVCGPATDVGLESTVVDTIGAVPRILRPGNVTYEQLKGVVPDILPFQSSSDSGCDSLGAVRSPGLKHRHYQPSARVILVDHPIASPPTKSAYIGLSLPKDPGRYAQIRLPCDLKEYASSLFQFFRDADQEGIQTIYCQSVEKLGVGDAIMDRLLRASARPPANL
jgi:L-threonylcarbamoyladenylate synthase